MLIITPGPTVRTRPIDNAIADYEIELNRSRHTRTPATATILAGESSATHPATSAETTRPMVPYYGKPPRLPSYRDNHAPPPGNVRHTPPQHPQRTARQLSKAARRATRRERTAHRGSEDTASLRMACQCTTQATAHSKAGGKDKEIGTGG